LGYVGPSWSLSCVSGLCGIAYLTVGWAHVTRNSLRTFVIFPGGIVLAVLVYFLPLALLAALVGATWWGKMVYRFLLFSAQPDWACSARAILNFHFSFKRLRREERPHLNIFPERALGVVLGPSWAVLVPFGGP
jgi:hypothetical protein